MKHPAPRLRLYPYTPGDRLAWDALRSVWPTGGWRYVGNDGTECVFQLAGPGGRVAAEVRVPCPPAGGL